MPESLRSRTFLEAATKVQSVHFEWNNFYNEPAPTRALVSLGTSIPISAFHRCMTAVLLVRIGNPYGVSSAAQPYADQMLRDVTADRWKYFFDDCLPVDDVLLGELRNETVAGRWCTVIGEQGRISGVDPSSKQSRALLKASVDGDSASVQDRAKRMLRMMRTGH